MPGVVFSFVLLIALLGVRTTWAAFEDDEACLLCHKYPKMARITEKGARRSYYVMPEVFGATVHRNVACSDCHNYIKQLPHRKVTTGVSCDAECHSVTNPATGKTFNHKSIVALYEKSTHGRPKVATGGDQDKPYCVTCHRNPLYKPGEAAPPKKIVNRCVVCHEDRKFVASWYNHTSRRILEVKRSSQEIVALCSSCHGDKRLVARHLQAARSEGRKLGRKYGEAVESYRTSFHGKMVRYGNTQAANCLDCHAQSENYFMSVHNIRPSRDPKSPVSKVRRVETCRRCHSYANANYATLDPHPTGKPEVNSILEHVEYIYNLLSVVAIVFLVALAIFETLGRHRDGVVWRLQRGSSWWRRSKRGRERVV